MAASLRFVATAVAATVAAAVAAAVAGVVAAADAVAVERRSTCTVWWMCYT